jgi:hypothetical protein
MRKIKTESDLKEELVVQLLVEVSNTRVTLGQQVQLLVEVSNTRVRVALE